MNTLRAFAVAGIVSLLAACSSMSPKSSDAPAAPKTAMAPAAMNISGTWAVTLEGPQGPLDQQMTVTQTGKDIKGTLSSQMGSVDYTGTVENNDIKFGFNFNAQGTDIRIDYIGTTDGATMGGKAVFGSFGEGTFKGKKQ